MQFWNHFVVIFLILINGNVFSQSQNLKSMNYYNKGFEMFLNSKYKQADSLFSISIKEQPDKTTYFRLAQTKMILDDTCGYCKNMKNAYYYGDDDAGTLYDMKCIIKRKLNFSNKLHPDSLFYAYFSKSVCTKKIISREYCIKNLKNDSVYTYTVNEIDSLKNIANNFPGSFPDFSNFIQNATVNNNDSTVYTVVETMPFYRGGDEARLRFLAEHLRYPQSAVESRIQGTVYISFVVECDGSVGNVKVLRGVGGALDDEAIRVVKLMPRWIPGTQNGKQVRVQYNMPLKFTL
jgi:TonB family protein